MVWLQCCLGCEMVAGAEVGCVDAWPHCKSACLVHCQPPLCPLPAPALRSPPFPSCLQLTNHVLMVLPAAAIGIICGIGAILFTLMNLKVGGWTG